MKVFFDANQANRELKTLVEINSFTQNKRGVDLVGQEIRRMLDGLNLKWQLFSHSQLGNLLIASAEKSDKKGPKILLSGHLDTVHPPQSGFSSYRREGELALGPGVTDMKGGLLIIIWLLRNLQQQGRLRNLTVTFVPDEEKGSLAHKEVLAQIYRQQDYALVFESTHDRLSSPRRRHLVVERKGVGIFELRVKGRAGHSGMITRKRERKSAVLELAHKIVSLEKLADYRRGTTLNSGKVKGGVAANVIAPWAKLEFDIRFRSSLEMKRVTREVSRLARRSFIPGTKTKLIKKALISPMEMNHLSRKMVSLAEKVARKQGLILVKERRGGGSDGNQIAQFGVGVLDGFGPIGSGGHTQEEKILFPSIALSVKFALELIKALQSG